MKTRFEPGVVRASRGIAVLMAVLMLAASVTPADAGGWKRHKKHRRHHASYVTYRPAPVVVRESCGGEALAGFVGGVVLGAVLTNAAQAAPAPAYYYYDPYCGERYSSFDACRAHVVHCSHPQVIRVVEYGSGRCVDTYQWHRGHWHDGDCCD